MTRPLRLQFEGALYHITSRRDGWEQIYLSNDDRYQFLEILGNVQERFNWVIHAHCLMTNYYHLLVETPDSNISKVMLQLNSVYTQNFNRRYNRVGHVFQGRYKAVLVEKKSYLLELARYVILNPVRAGMVRSPEQWPWSSYRAMIGKEPAPEWIETRWILVAFGKTESEASAHYARFVGEGIVQPSPWVHLKNQIFLGSDTFVKSMIGKIPSGRDLQEVPQAKARPSAKPLADFAREYPDRNCAIVAAYASGGYTMKEIGNFFELHYSRISKIVHAYEQTRRPEKRKT